MSRSRNLRIPVLLIAALAALLAFAATAAAETRTGESTSSFALAPSAPEATVVKGAASYETVGGSVVFNITTAVPPESENDPSTAAMIAGLYTSSGECSSNIGTLYALAFSGASGVTILNLYAEPAPVAYAGSLLSIIEGGGGGAPVGSATKSVTGSTTTLSVSSSSLVEQSYNCALVLMEGEGGESFMAFPVKAPPPPPAPAPAPVPAPAPAALSIAQPKPLKVKAKTWKTVHVKVANTGATATAQGSLRVKPAKGVLVKPEVQKLPILTPGSSFTLSVRVELTEKAKKKSTLTVTGSAPGLTATSSLVLKLKQ